jgi:alpha-ribazole phosphatase/probable phosphoglycerate mutase
MITTLLLIRHAQPEGYHCGYPRRLSGWHDVPLSTTGRAHAALLAQRLQIEGLAAPIYSSPLRRARETATTIAARLGSTVADLVQLKEIHCGELEGQLLEQVEQKYQAHWAANLLQRDPEFRWPGGESYREFRARCLTAVAQIAAGHSGQRVAVVTHAGVISQLIGHLHGMSPARWDRFRPGTASVTDLEWRNGNGALLKFDDREHLQPADWHATTKTEHQP